jgi:hypothetical protein
MQSREIRGSCGLRPFGDSLYGDEQDQRPAQRQAIADVMEELTGFASLLDRVVVMSLELDAMLSPFAKLASALPTISLLGRGVRHSFGRASGVRVMGPDGDATEEVRTLIGAKAFDDFVADAELQLDRSVLRGPADDGVRHLRALGWKPETTIQSGEKLSFLFGRSICKVAPSIY